MAPADTADNWKTHHRGLQALSDCKEKLASGSSISMLYVTAASKQQVYFTQHMALRGAGVLHWKL